MATRKYTIKFDIDVSADVDFSDPFQRMEVFRALHAAIVGALPTETSGEKVGVVRAAYGPVTAVS